MCLTSNGCLLLLLLTRLQMKMQRYRTMKNYRQHSPSFCYVLTQGSQNSRKRRLSTVWQILIFLRG
ncbi:Uncharacterised protein [Klebsiella pneumoniae]|nr:Uncharacterised protein [Klebsiella pneumoniae]